MDLTREKKIDEMREAVLRKLSYRARTEKEIRDWLKLNFLVEKNEEAADETDGEQSDEKAKTLATQGYSATEDDIEEVIETVKEYGYLDDRAYVRGYYRTNRPKGKSESRIVSELARKGISAALSKEVLEEMKQDEEEEEVVTDREAAVFVANKMCKAQLADGKELDDRFQARVMRRLAGLGYDSATSGYILSKIRDARKRLKNEEK